MPGDSTVKYKYSGGAGGVTTLGSEPKVGSSALQCGLWLLALSLCRESRERRGPSCLPHSGRGWPHRDLSLCRSFQTLAGRGQRAECVPFKVSAVIILEGKSKSRRPWEEGRRW